MANYSSPDWTDDILLDLIRLEDDYALPVLSDPDRLNLILSRTPLGKVGQPEDIAAAVAFLCMGKAGHITGQNIAVDGGFLVKGL